jgi:hypothetical protein
MPASARQAATCDDCYFRRRGLCALALERPCPTFRPAATSLQPPAQAPLIPRPLPVLGFAAAAEAAGAAA